MKVVVGGAGAIGQLVGGMMHEAGHDVTLLTTPRHRDAFARIGLCVRGETNYCWNPTAIVEVDPAADPFDVVLVTCKAYLTATLAPQLAPVLAPTGFALSIQNGFGNGAKLRAAFGASRTTLALTSHGVTLEAPGKLHHAGIGPTVVGPAPGCPEAPARRAHALLAATPLAPDWAADMRVPTWRKALINHSVNPVAAVHGLTNGELLDSTPHLLRSLALLAEGGTIAAKAGVVLESLSDTLRATLERTRANRVSMLQDVLAQRPTEAEQITGRLARVAQRLAVPAPRAQAAYESIKEREASYLGAAAAQELAKAEIVWEAERF